MEFREELARRAAVVEEIIKKYLPKEEGYQKAVIEAMNYSFLAGGKRLRPMLMSETYRMFGGNSDVIEPFMAAIEMIHTYSLIHDDLPALDNDEYRRGRKTAHVVYGEAIAILAGDGLLNFAFETAMRAFFQAPKNENVAAALALLAKKAGIYGMIGGQTVDIKTDQTQEISKEQIDFIYRLKTGALIEASMMIGAILAGAAESEVSEIEQIAAKVGLAFQIQDDILDCTSTTEELGKPVGSDAKNQKATYVTYEGLKRSKEAVKRLSDEAVVSMRRLAVKNEFLTELMLSLVYRER